ncbi:hypothetical protein OGAPHI_005380 [Ogataea philodendri]|uniref:Protein disulfide-isomerase n=1 Tax=Ogataea philodendri TaxID=1378263 RepID=A0A9P8P162_9ASCO|nr:uncharacterized protein OGAPHI_005380 [Ogataea philodendri]KAH3663390.1 hypothetical protein OGAPHI_005380 [Ogataea philodendri]
MKFINVSILTSVLAMLAVAKGGADDAAIASPDSAVVKLTADTFGSFIKENPLVLAEFFAPWCGHCKSLGPKFSAAADKLVEKDIKLAQIDCTQERDLCADYGIRGYPTLKVFRGTTNSSDYLGQREEESIISYMTKQSLPSVSAIEDSADLLDTFAELSEPVILQVLPPDFKPAANETFYSLADELRNEFSFVSTSNPEYVEKYTSKKSTPAYVVFRPGEKTEDASLFKGDTIDKATLESFIGVETKPLFGEISGATFQSYMESKLPLAYFFWDDESQKEAVSDAIIKLAKKFRGEINFVGLEAKKYGMHAKNLNMKEEFPLFVIHDLEGNFKYGISQDKALNYADIPKFVEEFKAGKALPIVKSEPIPEVQDEAVYHLVGYEHDKVVQQKKDVLVEYYAPWCGHCKRLAPTYEELAALYKNDSDANEKVVIAKIDHTANDVSGIEITGYPTIFLYPADGSKPISYEGQRSLEALANFIQEKGSTGVDALKIRDAKAAEPEAEESTETNNGAHDEL